MDGVVLIRKPPGPTSHDIVQRLRRILETRAVGHFGTLDPFAEGLLVVAVGKATRFCPFYSCSDKVYEGRIRLGTATDTYDSQGLPLESLSGILPDRDAVAAAMARFQGPLIQTVPPFSAKKHQGKPLYDYARRRIEIAPKTASVRIDRFILRTYAPPDLDFEVACSGGTYVRALAHDLGRVLHCGGHLTRLVRTAAGEFRLDEARTPEEIAALWEKGRRDPILRPLETLLPAVPRLTTTAAGQERVRHGRAVDPDDPEAVVPSENPAESALVIRLFGPNDRLIALARRAEGRWRPFLVLI